MARDHLAPRRRHHARHNKMVRRMAIINRKKGGAQAWRFKTSRHRRVHNPKGWGRRDHRGFKDGGARRDKKVRAAVLRMRDNDVRFWAERRAGLHSVFRRNPGHDADFVKQFRDGGRIEVWNDGEVCVFDNMDRDQDDYHIKPHEVPALIRDVNAAKFGAWHHYTKDMVRDDYEMQGRGKKRNPRGRKRGGSRFTKHRSGRKWESAVSGSMPHWANPRRGRGRRRNPEIAYRHPRTGKMVAYWRSTKAEFEADAKTINRIMAKGRYTGKDGLWYHRKSHRKGAHLLRRNPDVNGNAGKAHPAYGQYLLKLGFGMNDPIVELGAAWARGEAGGSRLIQQAIISAERSMESRDRRVAQNAKNVVNKLRTYLKEQERHEGYRHKSGFKEGSLVGSFRYAKEGEFEALGRNPRRRGRGRRR